MPRPGLLERTIRTTTLLGAVAVLWTWAGRGPVSALVFALGTLTSVLSVSAVVLVVKRTVVPPEQIPRRKWPYGALHIGKVVLAGCLIFAIVRLAPDEVVFFAAGYSLFALVLLLKAVGAEVNRRLGIQDAESGSQGHSK